MAVLEVKPTNE